MFSLKSLISCPLSVNVKLFRSYRALKPDPGIHNRKQIIGTEEFDELDDADFDKEAEFMEVQKSYKEHLAEVERNKERLRYQIVKRKYFKQHYPNFLTWNEKEQIRYLNSTNPEEWTIERLSESFPALPEIIHKVIQAKYTKKESRVIAHDEVVRKNWELLKKGKIPDLPYQLTAHLKKFTNRGSNFTHVEIPKVKEVVVNKRKVPPVFSEIITSYESLKNNHKEKQNSDQTEIKLNKNNLGITEDKIVKKKFSSSITLQSLQYKLERRLQRGEELAQDEKLILKSLKVTEEDEEPKIVELAKPELKDTSIKKYESSGSKLMMKKTGKDYSHLMYPERIHIPKNKLKNGYTYKLNDCYYDSDGRFLYRVPGMY